METLVPPGAEVAPADALAVAEFELPELDELVDLLFDEQPDRPATTIAAPHTATSNPRFTTVLLFLVRSVKIGGSSPAVWCADDLR